MKISRTMILARHVGEAFALSKTRKLQFIHGGVSQIRSDCDHDVSILMPNLGVTRCTLFWLINSCITSFCGFACAYNHVKVFNISKWGRKSICIINENDTSVCSHFHIFMKKQIKLSWKHRNRYTRACSKYYWNSYGIEQQLVLHYVMGKRVSLFS